MRRGFPPSLRWSLPALLLLVGAAAVLIGYRLDLQRFTELALMSAREDSALTAERTAAAVDRAFRNGRPHEARDAIDAARIDRHLGVAMLLDGEHRVLFASDYALEGVPLAETRFAALGELADEVLGDQGRTLRSRGDDRLIDLALPIQLEPRIEPSPSAGRGVLICRFDLSELISGGRALAIRRTRDIGMLFLALVVLLWTLLSQWITARAARLVRSTWAIAAGDFTVRTGLSGSDELARLSRSIDRMASALGETTTELADRERWYRQLIEHGSDVIFVIDRDGAMSYASPSVERVLGIRADDLAGRRVSGLVVESDVPRLQALLARVFDGESDPEREEIRLRGADGRTRDLEIAAYGTPELLAEGQCVLNARDLTDWRRLEDRLRQASKMEAVGRLAGGVAHDFNNLLTVILGHAEGLGGQLAPGSPAAGEVDEIEAAARRAAELTRQLLAFGRRQLLQPVVLDLNEVVRGVETMLRRLIDARIELALELAPGQLAIRADRAQLETAIVNLAINGGDAMPAGGRLTLATSAVELDPDRAADLGVPPGRCAVLRVTDTGVGMPPEVRDHAFEPFFTTKDVGRGTGLGLSTVLGIVEQSGGAVSLTTAVGEGTTFELFFRRESAAPEASAEGGSPGGPPAEREATILIAEDEPAIRRLLVLALGKKGYRVLEASSSGQAMELAGVTGEPIDLLITDVVMPGRTGPELAAELSRSRPELRVIYITGYSEDVVRDDLDLGPGTALLTKPFRIEELVTKVADTLSAPAGRAG